METMINVTLSDGSEIREKYYVSDDVPRSLINDMAFKEAYAKYNGLQKTIKALSASFDWMSDDTNETTSKETYTLEQIKNAFWSKFNEAGELWFNNLGSREENEDCTEEVWEEFVENLYKICPTPRALDVCPSCAGKGIKQIGVYAETCPACHGAGVQAAQKRSIMLNTFEMDGKRYIILPDDSVELFDNWLVGQNLRLAEEQKRLTPRVPDAGDSSQ